METDSQIRKKTIEREEDLERSRHRMAELEHLAEEGNLSSKLSRLATFPEQNPNVCIEATPNGRITYLNPDAQRRFPDLQALGFEHPLLQGIDGIIKRFESGDHNYVTREVDLKHSVFERKVCFLPQERLVHIYAHDVTSRKRAEEEVKELAMQLRRLTQQIVLTQEDERRRVAHELHDEAGQALVALKISLRLLSDDLPSEAVELKKNMIEAISLVDRTRNRIRMIARGLRPPELDTVGLNSALEGFCREFARRTQLNIHYSGLDHPRLPEEVSICLYRFLQEALTNVAEHSGAQCVAIQLAMEGNILTLEVMDDGKGFSAHILNESSNYGLGLLGMKERLQLLHGRLEIQSCPGGGTRLIARVRVEKS